MKKSLRKNKYKNIGEFIKSAVDSYGDMMAMQIRRGLSVERYSYNELWDASLRFRTFLREKGVKKGDMVLLWGPNMPEWVIVLFGAIVSGVVVVPVSMHASAETVDGYITQTKAVLLIQSKFIPEKPSKKINTVGLEDIPDVIKSLKPTEPAEVDPDDLAEIMYTSGTTGDPSGVMLSHKNILGGLQGLKALIPPSNEYRLLSILPLSHALEQFVGLFTVLDFGASMYYVPRVNPVTIAKSLRKYRITHIIAVPQLLKLLWDALEYRIEEEGRMKSFKIALKIAPYLPMFLRRFIFRKIHMNLGGALKVFACAGAPLDVKIAENWEKIGIVVIEGYGLTETSAGLAANKNNDRRLGSVGKILPEIEVRFTDDGEILARGSSVTAGYFKNEEKTKESFTDDGFFKTGDIGYMDDDGFVYLSGRKTFKIITPSGEKVYPEDVERKLNEHPMIKESCVVGMDKGDGEIVYAAVILRRKVPIEEVISDVNGNLESHQTILEYGIWPEEDFPRTRTLKKDRLVVKEWAMDQVDGESSGELSKVNMRDSKEQKPEDTLIGILKMVCDIDASEINEDTNLVLGLDLDSLKRVALVSLIEEEYGVEISEENIDEKTTVAALRDEIARGKKVSTELSHATWPLRPLVVELREIARRFLMFPLFRLIASKPVVKGKENLENIVVPSILIFNHVGHNEPAMILRELPPSVRRKQTSIADPRSFRGGVRSFNMHFWGSAFPVQKFGGSVRHTLELVADLLDGGWMVVISPEGERSADGSLQEFKHGVGALAVETGVPVYPVKVKDYRKVYPKQGKNFDIPGGKGRVTLVFGKPMRFTKDILYEKATEEMRETIENM